MVAMYSNKSTSNRLFSNTLCFWLTKIRPNFFSLKTDKIKLVSVRNSVFSFVYEFVSFLFSSKDFLLMSPMRPIHTLCFACSLLPFWTCSDVVFVVLVLCFSVFSIFMYYVFFLYGFFLLLLSFLFRYTPLTRTTFSVAKQSASFTHSNTLFTSNDV